MEKSEKDKEEPKEEKNTTQNDNEINNKDNNKEEKPKLPISKNQLKKMKRQEEWKQKMEKIKAYKKEKKRLKREEREKEELLNPKITEPKKEINKDIPFKSRKQIKEEFKEKCKNGMRVIIDCDFEHLMDERCIKSMVRQIVDLYSINKYSTNPFRVILYGVGKQIKEGLEKSDYKNWIGIEIYFKEDYPNFDKFIEDILYKDDKRPMKDIKYNIYYLSADSENNIENIDKNSTYIIGGIVDRNKYKGLSLNKAKELGINHGKFPIGEYLKLQSSQVLTTNHTFHILNEFSIRHDWKEAFVSIIPKRKQEENEELEEDKKSDKK